MLPDAASANDRFRAEYSSATCSVPANASSGSWPTLQSGQPGEQEVDLQLRARGFRSPAPPRPAGSAASTARRWRARAVPARCAAGLAVVPGDLGAVRRRADAADAGAGHDLGTPLGRRREQRRGDRAHAADGHLPLAGAVADQVVEEAAVLDQRGVVQVGEGADQRVGRDHAAHEVVGEPLLDHLAERPLDDLRPRWARVDPLAQQRRRWGGERSGSARRRRRGRPPRA